MDTARELTQLGNGGAYVLDALGDEGRTLTAGLGELQRHDGFHQALLRSIMKVAYDLPALLVGSLHDPCP
jgi:hypothetical protein